MRELFSMDRPIYRTLESFSNLVILNLLWILMCLPIITIFPATIAMFGVIRQWINKEDDRGLTRSFFLLFKQNFRHGLLLGVIILLFGTLVAVNFSLALQLENPLKMIYVVFLSFLSLLYTFTCIYLFPLLVNYKDNWKNLLKNALLLSIIHLPITVICIITLFFGTILIVFIPLTFIIVFSLTAYVIYYLCSKSFDKVKFVHQLP